MRERTNLVVKLARSQMKIFEGRGKLLETVPGIPDRATAKKYLEKYVDNPILQPARDDWFMQKKTAISYIVYEGKQ